jgi:hypothetical protein
MYVLILIAFLLFLFIYHLLSTNKEGMESKDGCQGELQTTVYKNAGAIANLEEKVTSLMKQISAIVTVNDKQTSQIGNMSDLQDKYDKIASDAETTAKSNAQKILDIVKQAQQKGKATQDAQKKLQPIG